VQRKQEGVVKNLVSGRVIDAAIEVHRVLGGPGLLESVYEEALVYELKKREIEVERQKSVPVRYKDTVLTAPLILDVLVENCVIVECKATTEFNKIFEVQLLTYLRLTGLKLGLVINFGERYVKDGIYRVVNRL
jgi:GxxExxY protein